MDKQISAMLKWKGQWAKKKKKQIQDNMVMCYQRENQRTLRKTSSRLSELK